MIGRKAELAALAAAVSADDRRPVVLLGEEGIGKTTLLRAAARMAGPGALIIDDAHLLRERPSRLPVIAAATGPMPPEALGSDVREILVPPLSDAEAAELLDQQPDAPAGWLRGQVLRICRGNPLGIVELARAAGSSTRPLAGDHMTLPAPIRRIFADRLAALPGPARRVLLYAAAAGDEERLHTILAAARADVADVARAERAELVAIAGDRLVFRHPLARVACYLGAPLEQRRHVHRDLAAVLPAGPASWHLVCAREGPQERLAVFLEEAADLAAEERRYAEAAGQLEHAALVSAGPEQAAARLARAAQLATLHGDARWCRLLWDQVGELSADPDLRGRALLGGGFAEALAEPVDTIVPRVDGLLRAGVRDRAVVLGLTAAATGDVLISGRDDLRAMLAGILAAARITAADGDIAIAVRAAAQAVIAPGGPPPETLREPGGGPEEARLLPLALIAWLRDDPTDAVSAQRHGIDLLRARAANPGRPFSYVLLLETLLDTGSWQEAAEIGAEAAATAVTGRLSVLRRAIAAQTASLRVRQGDLDAARNALIAGTASSDSRLVRCLTSRAAGELAAAEGDWDRATTNFRGLFQPDGTPLHFAWSYRVVADLAGAAANAGRRAEATAVLDRFRARTRWQTVLRGRAAALLGMDDETTTERYLAAAAGPDAAGMPYHHATARLDYAEWLRVRWRQAEARSQLSAAVETLRRIGASGRLAAAQDQLRAAGVAREPVGADGFAALTAQQQLISRLAAQGMSNREIASRLAVSPRTVGSHLYQIYPKLGVATRRQLADVIPEAA
jgi:DNA-binding CsgD family transcriptional regulator